MARARRSVSAFLRDLDRRVLPTLGNAVPWMLRGARYWLRR